MVIFQILAVYYQSLNDLSSASAFCDKAIHQCSLMRDLQLLIIPSMKNKSKESISEVKLQQHSDILLSQPLKCEIIFLLSEATKTFADADTKQCFSNSLLQIIENIEREAQISLGLLTFQNFATHLLWLSSSEDPQTLYAYGKKYYQTALTQYKESSPHKDDINDVSHLQNEAHATGLLALGRVFINRKSYPEALQVNQQALEISQSLLGEEQESSATSFWQIGCTQHEMRDYSSALQSHQRALAIRTKQFGEGHESTADSYVSVGLTQHEMQDCTSALQSLQRALAIRIKVFGEEHERTADSYVSVGLTQHKMQDYTSALQSFQRALAIRIIVFGREH